MVCYVTQGYFCPTGTADEELGILASDSFVRRLTAVQANPFYGEPARVNVLLPGERLPRNISSHDDRCFQVSRGDFSFVVYLCVGHSLIATSPCRLVCRPRMSGTPRLSTLCRLD
jgi:hypothetical protein